jgi:hypothetical protein
MTSNTKLINEAAAFSASLRQARSAAAELGAQLRALRQPFSRGTSS